MAVRAYLKERVQSFGVYAVFAGVLFGIWMLVQVFIPKGNVNKSSTNVGKVESGGKIITINKNTPPPSKQGLYVALTSEDATVGVFKQMTNNVRLALGAGETFDGDLKAEVRAEVSF